MSADTAQQAAQLSPEARNLYRRLVWWWILYGEWLWARKDLHQKMKTGPHFRRVAELDERLSELQAAGLIRRWDQRPIGTRRSVVAYALIAPQSHTGKVRGRPRLPYAPMPS